MKHKHKHGITIVKANELIKSNYRLGKREQLFILTLLSTIPKKTLVSTYFELSFEQIQKVLNGDGVRRITDRKEVDEMMIRLNQELVYTYDKETNSVIRSVWIASIAESLDTGVYKFHLAPELTKFIMNLEQDFTQYHFPYVVNLNAFGIRLYENFKRMENLRVWEITVEDLKHILGLQDKYKAYYEFKRRVLEPSLKLINSETDLWVKYVPKKKIGKTIVSLEFKILENKSTNETAELMSKIRKVFSENVGQLTLPLDDPSLKKKYSFFQYKAHMYLLKKGVNKTIIENHILKSITWEGFRGYEDIYVKLMWEYFAEKNDSETNAGVFVSWVKNEKSLTSDDFRSRMSDVLRELKQKISLDEQALRKESTRHFCEVFEKNNSKEIQIILKYDITK